MASIPGNEGRITQVWVNVRGGMRFFRCTSRHSEGWTPRNEARATEHSWLVACGVAMRPVKYVVAPKEGSTCTSKGAKGEWIEKNL